MQYVVAESTALLRRSLNYILWTIFFNPIEKQWNLFITESWIEYVHIY